MLVPTASGQGIHLKARNSNSESHNDARISLNKGEKEEKKYLTSCGARTTSTVHEILGRG